MRLDEKLIAFLELESIHPVMALQVDQ